jgi:ABC-type glycerol-3-phosphate transport system permease component
MSIFKYSEPLPIKRKNPAQTVLDFVKYAVLLVLGATYLLPFYWMVSSAIKNQSQVYTIPPVWLPLPGQWINFVDAWKLYPFDLYLFNTIFKYAIPVCLGTILSSAIVAYGFGRLRWTGRNIFFAICISTMMVPFQVTMVPLFIIFRKLGWINTFLPLDFPAFFGNPYFIFMLRQFFRTIPEEFSDAARIDGATEFDILFRLILPLSRPALTVVGLFAFMGAWNDYLGPLIYLNKPETYTLSIGLQSMSASMSGIGNNKLAYPYLMAVSAIITLPILILFFFAQRTFIEGITLTGLKG